ncbi:Dabb family protein [Paracoccus sp. (in: a-proteobacteria)]|uniref:Dabb family protein n=1 Tax=Paracoccus sp. TaxID=267 RepID=UPI00396C44CA
MKFKPDTGDTEIAEIFFKLSSLTEGLHGAHGFTGGRSRSPEQIERGYLYAFVVDFDGWPDLKAYADHPEHQTLSSQIIDCAIGGMDGIIMLDLEV